MNRGTQERSQPQKTTAATPEVSPVHITPEVLEGTTAMETAVDTLEKGRFLNHHLLYTSWGLNPFQRRKDLMIIGNSR